MFLKAARTLQLYRDRSLIFHGSKYNTRPNPTT
jgi:hypothetical protein